MIVYDVGMPEQLALPFYYGMWYDIGSWPLSQYMGTGGWGVSQHCCQLALVLCLWSGSLSSPLAWLLSGHSLWASLW